ncbi:MULTISPECIES: maltose alpha-D-glucosyltransferase [unclassified Rhodococcus (in: high G+C Gram-positive bacteria)]|uniref:maltose alpha-D-glucosyltransferase n=1 Tax=unclassified Rhodococcus (in: high G+C Gram-positive bacteria) TaxID=192944 RepID=UPI00163A0CD1|nr:MULTISPECIES: maltose alpha-D-glucosyltransferase [unclassified Rhodococcus (in: high G+C Gram-positive bacteria)]MBC2641815.1 maltose alpha-D-glucosyltransferase [Rhodococcus sp. 3A]MBC2893441.1 maltose alpha-D-glucosyltransferase [Rhodococcus sp. 4CII]
MNPEIHHEPSEISYDEQFYPARPRPLKPSVRRAARVDAQRGDPVPDNPDYVEWLINQSILHDAKLIAEQLSGKGSMWQNPYADPNPRAAVERGSVWFTAYPISIITAPGASFLSSLGDEALWQAFSEVGVTAVHTGPVKQAGGINGWRATPSVDGHFDRISMQIDSAFGTEEEFRKLCVVAAAYDGIVIDDIVPGHTGKGADFRLAEMAYADYPGIYHMVEIEQQDWHLLPRVPDGRDSVNIDADTEAQLARAGYIIGQLQRVIFYELGVKETNWSVTPAVKGVDGVERRWVYLHYFKAGQPSINWLDPSFAGMRLVIGDACHSIADLGAGALRLDANGFLGVERRTEGLPGWSEGHPLSEAANHLIASIVRKMGGFTFQELNLTIDDIKAMGTTGADLSYDFINRPAYHHALVMGNTEFLRLTMNLARDHGVDAASLVHALQNHDELTFELVHFATLHKDDEFDYGGETVTGSDLGDRIRKDLCERLTGRWAPYNRTFTTNGIACTTASVITATLGIRDLDRMDAADIDTVKQAHLLLAMFNALQPGVFALSGWDLCGLLPVPSEDVVDLLAEGDTRWINRGAHDLMGVNPDAERSESGIPRGRSLYGSLPVQLQDPTSFARRLARIIDVRNRYGIATAVQLDVPTVSHKGLLVMVHELADASLEVTVLNFTSEEIAATVQSQFLPAGSPAVNLFTDEQIGAVDELHSFPITLAPYEGVPVLVRPESA